MATGSGNKNDVHPKSSRLFIQIEAPARDGLWWSLLESCISGADSRLQLRPYHCNSICALHNSGDHFLHCLRYDKVSYPIRRSWSEGSLMLIGQSSQSPPSSPTAASATPRTSSQLELSKTIRDEEEEVVSASVGAII